MKKTVVPSWGKLANTIQVREHVPKYIDTIMNALVSDRSYRVTNSALVRAANWMVSGGRKAPGTGRVRCVQGKVISLKVASKFPDQLLFAR